MLLSGLPMSEKSSALPFRAPASWTVNALIHPACLRPASISRHVAETGIHALPIIGLMAVMIAVGVVLNCFAIFVR